MRQVINPPDDDTILQKYDDSLTPGVFEDFDEYTEPEVIDVDYGERRTLVRVTVDKWIEW
ncbi:MAG: hypothetical protein ABIG61_12230 [Planctomycetota bacterium]